MSQRIRANKARKRRSFTYLWVFLLAVSIFLMLYFEQTALLYILATLGVTVLLVVVAVADLGSAELPTGPGGQIADNAAPPSVPKSK